MPTVNPTFAQKCHELTAFAYQHKIDCPPLIGVNNWLAAQTTGSPAAAMPGAEPPTGSFDDAVQAAVRSSPNGVALADLRPILAEYKRTPEQIAAACRRLSKTIALRGSLYWYTAAGNGKAVRTTGQRRTRTRGTATKAPTQARARAGTAAPTNTLPLGEQVYALIPATGGIAQTSIKIRDVRPNIIGTALARLKKAGRLVEQNGVWFREMPAQAAA